MKLVTALAICVVGLALAVEAANRQPPKRPPPPPLRNPTSSGRESAPSQKELYQEGILNLLQPYCNQDEDCELRVFFAALVCSTPSESTICQSDCKFLLNWLWQQDFKDHRPEAGQLRQFVPDHCAPGDVDSQHSKGWTNDDDEDEIDATSPIAHEGNEHNMIHFGYDHDEDEEIQEAIAEFKAVVQYNRTVTCLASNGTELKPGQTHKRLCNEVYPFQIGHIKGVCLDSGFLYYSNVDCDLDFKEWSKAADDFNKDMTAMSAAGATDPKKALEGGATLLKGVADFLSKDKVKDFLPILGKIGTVLGPIGIAFQVIAFFLPASDPKHDEIMAAFKRLEEQTSEIKDAIERLPNVFKKELFDARIEQMVTNLVYLEGDIELYSTQNSEAFRNKVEKSCANFPGDKFINDVTQVFVAKSADYISQLYGYDHNEYSEALGKPLLVYSIRASQVALKCLGLDKTTTESDANHFAKTLEDRTRLMFDKINFIDDDWIPNNAMAQWIDPDLREFMTNHKGQDNQQLASSLYTYLNKKYDFYSFGIAVFDKDSSPEVAARSYKCFKCVGVKNSGQYFSDSQSEKGVQIMYSNAFIPDIEDKVIAVFNYAMRKNMQYYVDYLTTGSIRNALAVRFGQGLRTTMVVGKARFYNIQSVSTMVTY